MTTTTLLKTLNTNINTNPNSLTYLELTINNLLGEPKNYDDLEEVVEEDLTIILKKYKTLEVISEESGEILYTINLTNSEEVTIPKFEEKIYICGGEEAGGDTPTFSTNTGEKKNIFGETYSKVRAVEALFDVAATKQEKENLKSVYNGAMKVIKEKGPVAMRIWKAYKKAMENENKRLDLDDCILDKSVKGLIDCMRENGIEEFTFSSGWSGAVDTAWLFQQNGCTLAGMVEINGEEMPFSEEHEKLHAYLFKVNGEN